MWHAEEREFKVDSTAASVRRQVEDQLRRAIVQGRFAPGAHLSDRILQNSFQVSRTVVREAVRQLEAEGLIKTIPHRGSFVRTLSVREAEQVYAVRGVLEALAAKEFARNATDAEIETLGKVLGRIRSHVSRRGKQELIDLKQKFYDVLMAGCRNTHIGAMLGPLLNVNAQLRATSLSVPGRHPKSVAELEVLLTALKARDEEAAWAASLQHVQNAAAVALDILRKRGADAEPGEERSKG
jgi:DNA-binding GntR family transcriptional regulator